VVKLYQLQVNKTRLKQKLQTLRPEELLMSLAAHARRHSCRPWPNAVQHQTLAKNSWSRPPKSPYTSSGSSKIGIPIKMVVEQRCRSIWHASQCSLSPRVAMYWANSPATRGRLRRPGHFGYFMSPRVAGGYTSSHATRDSKVFQILHFWPLDFVVLSDLQRLTSFIHVLDHFNL